MPTDVRTDYISSKGILFQAELELEAEIVGSYSYRGNLFGPLIIGKGSQRHVLDQNGPLWPTQPFPKSAFFEERVPGILSCVGVRLVV